MSPLIGVNYFDRVLLRKEKRKEVKPDVVEVEKDLTFCQKNGWNLIRLPFYWETLTDFQDNFYDELESILSEAKLRDIKVMPSCFHWFGSSAWREDYGGFPHEVMEQYPVTAGFDYENAPAVKQFWPDLYTNQVKGVSNIWQDNADVLKQVWSICKPYRSIIYGLEILNEPHFWDDSDYAGLGEMHTYIAKELRKVTWKPIVFSRETTHGGYQRKPALEYRIRPNVNNTIYDVHFYQPDGLEVQKKNWLLVQSAWKSLGAPVKIMVGEFADQQVPNNPTQANTEKMVKAWHDAGFDCTYWCFNLNTPDPANRLADNNNVLTQVGIWYRDAIKKYYSS